MPRSNASMARPIKSATLKSATLVLAKWLKLFTLRTLFLAVLGFLAGGIIHICYTLAIPYASDASAYKHLAPKLPINQITLADPVAGGEQLLPFVTPGVRYALCHYNIHRGPVKITARLLDPSWTLALYTPFGDNFYVASGLETKRLDIAFELVPPGERFLGLFSTARTVATDRNKIPVPSTSGLLVIRAPIGGAAFAREVDEALKLASCTQPALQ